MHEIWYVHTYEQAHKVAVTAGSPQRVSIISALVKLICISLQRRSMQMDRIQPLAAISCKKYPSQGKSVTARQSRFHAWGIDGRDEFSPPASGCIIEFKSRGFHLPSCQIEFGVIAFCRSTAGCHVYFFSTGKCHNIRISVLLMYRSSRVCKCNYSLHVKQLAAM